MAVSLESYLMINFFMNTIIIAAIARSRGRIRWHMVLGAALFGAMYALAMRSGFFPQLNYLPCHIALAVLMTLVGVKVESIAQLASASLMMIACTVFLGGAQMLAIRLFGAQGVSSLIAGALIGGAALVAVLEARGKKLERFEAQVLIRSRGQQVRLTALIDTGNRLHEPISALPVLIVEASRIAKLLPPMIDPMRLEGALPPGFRLVSYGALGGQGRMACFAPDELLVSYGDGWMRAPDVWVAVYPGKMPGGAHALAPSVIGRIQSTGTRKIKSGEGGRYRWSIPHSR